MHIFGLQITLIFFAKSQGMSLFFYCRTAKQIWCKQERFQAKTSSIAQLEQLCNFNHHIDEKWDKLNSILAPPSYSFLVTLIQAFRLFVHSNEVWMDWEEVLKSYVVDIVTLSGFQGVQFSVVDFNKDQTKSPKLEDGC